MIASPDGNNTPNQAQTDQENTPSPATPPAADHENSSSEADTAATALAEKYGAAVDFEQDVWPSLPAEDRLADILASLDDPVRWFDPPIITTLAEFYHEKVVWGSIKARARAIGLSAFDLEAAVQTVVRRTAREKLLEAMQGDVHAITPDDLVANFTEAEWLMDETLLYLEKFYDDAPAWMRLKVAAKKCGINIFDLEKAVRQVHSRQTALKPPTPTGTPQIILTGIPAGDWKEQLYKDTRGNPRPDLGNINLILGNDPAWKDRFWWDAVRGVAMLDKRVIDDRVVEDIGTWLSLEHRMSITNDRFLERRIKILCQETPRDLLQEWLANLPAWDNVARLNDWFSWVCAIPHATPYVQDISRLLILGPVARAIEPGCQYRYVIILKGAQDIGKSELVRRIAGEDIYTGEPWYGSLTHDLANKESLMLLQGSWICELEELESFRGTSLTKLKSYITSRNDIWIPKFSNNRMSVKRRTVFIGSTNEDEIFRDPTGETRYLPITLEAQNFNLDHFDHMREQLFAEALAYYKQHAGDATHKPDWWKLSDAGAVEAEDERENGRQASIYEGRLREWIENTLLDAKNNGIDQAEVLALGFRPDEVLSRGLGITDPERWKDAGLQTQVGRAMRALGWKSMPGKIRNMATGRRESQRFWKPG
jgi:hypothetical protein